MGAPPVIRVSGRSSKVTITAVADTEEVRVDGATVERCDDGSLDVVGGSDRVEVRCPIGTSVMVSTASGSVTVRGGVGAVRVLTASGHVDVAEATEVEVRTAAGRVEVGQCRDTCRVHTKSGRVEVGIVGDADLSSESGKISVAGTDHAHVRSVSGRIDIGAHSGATVHAHSVSGQVRVRMAGSSPVQMGLTSVSGRIDRRVTEGVGGARVDVDTVSGSIVVEGT